ncbi:MAG: bacteriophage holin [Bacteroidota bacterium]
MKLRVRALGLSVGVLWGVVVFAATLWAAWEERGITLSTLEHYYPGYSVSASGALAGLFWGFVTGFLGGALVAWLYNRFHAALYKADTGS